MTSIAQLALDPVLIAGEWRDSTSTDSFTAENPATRAALRNAYPRSEWQEVEAALDAATIAAKAMRKLPATAIAAFLEAYANGIEANADAICEAASLETSLPVTPRLKDVELPRTTNQLRQAAASAREEAWRLPTIDAATNIRSVLEPLGPVAIFGPNNFPLAFNAISGGDFAAAIAAGCPVVAVAHYAHPKTTRLLAECAHAAAQDTNMPAGIVQMVYGMNRESGLRLVADRRIGASAFTGSKTAGLALKAAADKAGKPIFLEMSSINPVAILPGALEERFDNILDELQTSALMAAGQFCTSPGLIVLPDGDNVDRFIAELANRFEAAPNGTLLGKGVMENLSSTIEHLIDAGATVKAGAKPSECGGYAWSNTLLTVTGKRFLEAPWALRVEAFGNSTLVVTTANVTEMEAVIAQCEGNLTGTIYSHTQGQDDDHYDQIAATMRPMVGRLLNDKMPTGVAVSPAMNHGGPFPATGQPHFTAVGLPGAMRRFTALACYDNVRPHRLPAILRDK